MAAALTRNGRPNERWTKINRNEDEANNLNTKSIMITDYKDDNGVGMPVTKAESHEGRKQLSNGMYRIHRVLTDDEVAQGKGTRWTELEVHGNIRNISPALWELRHLTALFLNGNLLTRIPPQISQLCNLTMLDLSHNKLRSLPAELGDMISLCHLYLNSNQIRVLPYELGKLFRLQTLGLAGNPLSPDISKIYHDVNGPQKLLQHLLDHLATAESESSQEVQHEKPRNHKEYKPQKQYYTPNRYYGYSRSTFSPQDYFVQYTHPKGYIFYNPNIAWNECYYRPSYTTEQLVRGLSNLNFCAQETDGNATSESPNSLSSTSSLSTSYSSQYSFDDYLTTEQGANNFPAISAKTRKLCSELFLVPEINTAPPPDRQWIMIRHTDAEKPIATFTVLCYNVLCDKYATTNLYSYCPTWALNWEYRKFAILKELQHYEADIITLQEVETEQFRMTFLPKLESLGYAGIFSPKSRAKTMNEEDRKYVDGCAIFWKTDKFEIEHEQLIEFTQVAIKKAQAHENMLNRVMPRDNIALVAVFKIKETLYTNSAGHRPPMNPNESVVGTPLIVCTAHIHWDPEFCDVKLIQSMMLAHELNKIVEDVSEKHRIQPQQTPVLICGDLNSLPDSGVFEYLSKGAVAKDHPDLKTFRDDPCLNRLSANVDDPKSFSHALRLDSAVDLSHMPFTNYTLEFRGMIDYIFATQQSLARLGILGALDMSWIQSNKIIGFPHPHVPSDHVPIMAQYAVIPTSYQRPLPPIQHYGTSHSSSFGAVGR
uniref:poly(A)-specific ribonuclease n=1 Tax=Acrobeloides nanus TaxID=290746 RepID=A0A914CJR2_9BILA